jgi:membrane-bound lytic murein transglycosylase D
MRIRRAARALVALALLGAHATTASHASAQPAPSKPKGEPAHHAQAKPAPPKAKPGAKATPARTKKGGKGVIARRPGEPGEPDEATRRIIAGTSARGLHESPELRAMRELDRVLFPGAAPSPGAPWVAEGTPLIDRGEPQLFASGLPPPGEPAAGSAAAPSPEPARDLSWLRQLAMPDIPVRWDARVVRYLEYYRTSPRGRSMVAGWLKKSGRYGGAIRRILREQGLPEDIVWLALVESGFDPTIVSPAGAAGLWQFMPEGARIYGLAVDRWLDERLDPERSTLAAARYLADLHQRFGSWELAFAAYNMGYGGLLSSIRKYNTNDFWELSRLESGMPLETALYVPKIVAMAIVARNRAAFGLADVELDPAASFDKISVRPGVSLETVAVAAGASVDKIAELNPQLTAGRTPPLAPDAQDGQSFTVRVPPGTAAKAAKGLPKVAEADTRVERYVVRWGESIDDIAQRRRTTRGMLASLNGLRRDEVLRPGTVLLVPAPKQGDLPNPYDDPPHEKGAAAVALAPQRPVVVVPAQAFAPPDRRRVFYRVMPGDTLRDVAMVLGVTPDEICRWNAIDPGAALHDGMTLQVYPPDAGVRSDVLVLEEKDAHVLAVGSPEFFSHFEGQRGRTRLEVVAKQGDTWRTVAHRYGLTVAQLERINGRARSAALSPGDKLVVYATSDKLPPDAAKRAKAEAAAPDAVAVAAAAPAVGDDGATKPAVLVQAPVAPQPLKTPAPGTAKGEAAANR